MVGYVLRLFSLVFFALTASAAGGPASSSGLFRNDLNGVAVDWSGFYAGLHGGYGWSNVDTGLGGVNVDGWLGGGHVGVQRQFDRWVLGIEASFSAGELDGHRTIDIGGDPLRLDAAISDLLLVTGRLGYAWDNRLLYLKAGYASADVEVNSSFLGVTTHAKSRLDGWTAGFGLERMITPNIIIGFEYNYIDLGSKSIAAIPGAAPVPLLAMPAPAMVAPLLIIDPYQPPKPSKIEPDGIHTVFARLTFRFGGQPAAAHESYK